MILVNRMHIRSHEKRLFRIGFVKYGCRPRILNKFKAIKKDFCGWSPSILFSLGYSVWKESNIGTIFYRVEGKNRHTFNFNRAIQKCEEADTEFKTRIFDRF